MAWRGRDEALECKTVEEFATYLRGLNYSNWRPSGMVLHNTASPTLEQWWHGGTSPEQRMENLISYYRDEMGWSAGPHAFVDGESIWVLTDFNVSGVHSPSWNASRLGIEMVGDYDTESDETGMGAKVMEMSVGLFAECHAFFGWEPSNTSIKLHKEDPATDHDCPGSNISKSEFVTDVINYMADGGDHHPPEPPPEPVEGIVYGLVAGDTLNIRASPSSSAPVIGTADNGSVVTVVGEAYNGSTRWFRLAFGESSDEDDVLVYGWASGSYIKRKDAPPIEEDWRTNITATVFGYKEGGVNDEQEGAYGEWVGNDTVGVSFPYKWRDEPRPSAIVIENEATGRKTEAGVVDVGPWNTDDPRYVLDGHRPMVETQYRHGEEAQNGRVPTNDAAIDLTRPVFEALGFTIEQGKGKVRWRFKES